MRDRDEHRTEDRAVAWYETLRNRFRPAEIQVLLVAESPPDPRAGERRFFYSPQLSYDNLYRGVATALYGTDLNFNLEDKPAVLERIKNDGIWLIDAVETPVNSLPKFKRQAAIKARASKVIGICRDLNPKRGVIICHAGVYAVLAPSLREAGVEVLHDAPLPFPRGNWRADFVAGFRRALGMTD